MSDTFTTILIFCGVLVLYIHIYKHQKCSNDLEVYEIVEITKDRLDEVLETLQPAVFTDPDIETLNMDSYHAFDVKIRNVNDHEIDISELYLPFSLTDAKKLFEKDVSKNYFSENNSEFLVETGLVKKVQFEDELLRPSMCSNIFYDLLMGSKDVFTPFRYHIHNRQFFVVLEGSVLVKLSPPKSSKFLDSIADYDNFEFRSKQNPFSSTFSKKVKCMDIELKEKQILFLPPYWWYSIKFNCNNTKVLSYSYRTFMSTVSIFPQLFMSFLQAHNIKRHRYPTLCKQLNHV